MDIYETPDFKLLINVSRNNHHNRIQSFYRKDAAFVVGNRRKLQSINEQYCLYLYNDIIIVWLNVEKYSAF